MDPFLTDTQRMIRDSVRRFAEAAVLPAAAAIDRDDAFPETLYGDMAGLGLFAGTLPEDAGGSGLDTLSMVLAMEELARCSGSVGNIFAVPVETAMFLHQHGDDRHWALLPGIIDGSLVPASATSEPDHGSDVAGIRTTAVRDGDHYVINGTKAWVSLGLVADLIIVMAKTDPDAGHRGLSCFMVHGDNPGLTRGRKEKLLGMHGLATCQLAFADCRVPVEDRIGPENGAFKMAMNNFNVSRVLMAAMALGICQGAFEDALDYAHERRQFGQPIFEFQAVQFMLADMSTDIAAARLMIHNAARLLDAGHPIVKEAAQLKLFTTRPGHAPHHQRRADPRWQRLFPGIPGRAPVPGHQADPDLRRHQPDPAHHHRPPACPRACGGKRVKRPMSPPCDDSVEFLTPAAFAPFGDVIQAPVNGGAAANQGTAQRFDDAVPLALTAHGGEPLLSLFRVQPVSLPVACTLMERHPLSTQAFVPLGERRFLVLVAPAKLAEPDALAVRAFLTNGRQGVNFRPGTWHHPVLALDTETDFVMVGRRDRGDDCDVVPFAGGGSVRLIGA